MLIGNNYIYATEKTLENSQKKYTEIKKWAEDNFLLFNKDFFTALKHIENKLPQEALLTLIQILQTNITNNVNNNDNYQKNPPYKTYFVQKYLNKKLNTIPNNITSTLLNDVIKKHYIPLQIIHNEYFEFIAKDIIPEPIDSIPKLLATDIVESKEDYFYLLLLFAIQEDIITDRFVYGELNISNNTKNVDKKDINNIDTELKVLIDGIFKNIKYKAAELSNKSGSKKQEEIKKHILDPIQNKFKISNSPTIDHLKNILAMIMQVQKKYTDFIIEAKNATQSIPALCNSIKEWLSTTTLPLIGQSTCDEKNIRDILYKIREQLIPKYHEMEKDYRSKISSLENNKTYKMQESMLSNLELVSQMPELNQKKEQNIFENEEAFNFYKNAYAFYESIVKPLYCEWALKNNIPCLEKDSLKDIVFSITQNISNKITNLNAYEPSNKLSKTSLQDRFLNKIDDSFTRLENRIDNTSTLSELQKIYNNTLQQEQKLKKIYTSWGYNNLLIEDTNNKDKSLEQIVTEIQNSIKQQFNSLPPELQKKELSLHIENAKTLNALSTVYAEVRKQKSLRMPKPENTTINQINVPLIIPAKNAPERKGWFSWLSSWFYSSFKK